jgi:class 3 adenylate cyclase
MFPLMNEPTGDKTLQQWASAGQRSLMLALVFTDIVGSTAKCNQFGDEQWIEILISHFRRARKVVRQFGGFEIKIIGDAFMVAFHSVKGAICFAMELQRKTGHEEVVIRAGVHVGPVRIVENDVYGSMVNYASRVIHVLEGEAVAASASAMQFLANEIGKTAAESLADSTAVRFKGWQENQTIWILRPDAWLNHAECHPLPDIDFALCGSADQPKYSIVPAETSDIPWIAQLQASAYTLDDAVPSEVLLKWFQHNPSGFSVIENANGERIGHIDILPLRTEQARPFLKGRTVEKEIPADWLYPPDAKHAIKDLYVESIIIKKAVGLSASPALHCVLRNLNSLIERLCPLDQVNDIYAIEATATGKKLISRIGFERCGEARARSDDHELFKIPASTLRHNIEELLNPPTKTDGAGR